MLEVKIQKYIRQKIEESVKTEVSGTTTMIYDHSNNSYVQVNKQLKRYVDYLKDNKENTTKLKETAEVS